MVWWVGVRLSTLTYQSTPSKHDTPGSTTPSPPPQHLQDHRCREQAHKARSEVLLPSNLPDWLTCDYQALVNEPASLPLTTVC
ncbi:hypothetical protein HBH92_063820 [Parastagonospora nodorum]|nr:hypothetical protein HBH42_072720 [Parastagonospora nodorum]KAH4417200.1 hypothetical protein HBH92_063820 [Parastagonospora nodorum]KAH4424340.1 hypothetical protein HBH93_188630 [Parastagonospora nodorum]KAH4457906.1 hypothetical protein HBH91_083840 [Parastagonospora nodorum]KAH4511393.1 hypothetical protein HBH89_043080 [Parastagonospora nodorum]